MKKTVATVLCASLVVVTAALAATFVLTKTAETSGTISFSWVPQDGADGYRFYAPGTDNGSSCSGTLVSRTFDPNKTTVKFGKVSQGTYCVEAIRIDPTGSAVWPVVTPPPGGCALPAFPDASCTGVPAGTTLTARQGPITVSAAGTVLQNLDVTYSGSEPAISVNAPNVVIRNVRVRSNGIALIQVNVGGSLLIEDSELINRPVAGQPNCHNGIATGNYTAQRMEITGCENGAEMFRGNVVFKDNYVHDLDTVGPSYVFGTDPPHADGIQLNNGATNVVISHNTLDPIGAVTGSGGTSGIIGNTSGDNVRIEDNYIDGRNAAYALYAPRTNKTAFYINRNLMLKGAFGYTACAKLGATVTEFTGNRDNATGELLTPDNGVGGGCTN